jgi:acetyl-CoA C-acetyltransferase
MQRTSCLDPRTPVIVGAGQAVQRTGTSEPLEPVELAVEALRRAGADSGGGDRLLRRADSVRHVATLGWPYRDEAAVVAAALGASARETVRTNAVGGDAPGRLVADSARAIAAGEADVVLLAGAEALATVTAHQRAGTEPPWRRQESGAPTRVLGEDRHPCNEAETAVGMLAPVNVYALIETALRARAGADRESHLRRIAALWSRFSRVAAGNPHAWLPRAFSAEQIAGDDDGNRRVSEPYTKLLTANIQVDLAAALVMCSVQAARDAGIAAERWVFPVAAAFAQDEWFFSQRAQLAASPAIRAAGRAALEHADVTIDDVAHIDLYSCFPSAVEIAAAELGLSIDDPRRPLTVTGGLTFAGGPGNNYAMHGVAALVERLREDPRAIGLASALGWYVTKHAYGLYSASPPSRPFREIDANARVDPAPARQATAAYRGPATLEAYTVAYGRDGTPEAAVVSALAPDGARALVRTGGSDDIAALLDGDPLGGTVILGDGRVEL